MPNNNDPGLSSLIPAILKSVEHTLGTDLAAEISTPNGRALLDMVRRLVRWSIAEIEQHDTLYGNRSAAEQQLLKDPTPASTHSSAPASGLYVAPTPAEQRYFRDVEVLSATLKQEMTNAQGRSENRSAVADRLRRLLKAEVQFHAALDPESAADIASAYQGGKSDASQDIRAKTPSVTIESLNAYLHRRFPQFAEIAANNLQMLTGGMGKDTILFELSGHPKFSGPLVIRKDLPVLCLDVSAVDEFPLLQAVHAAGVAAPEPLWAETDPQELGSRFIVVRRAQGIVAIAQEIPDENIRRHFADKLAEGLAAIHNLSLPQLELFRRASGKTMSVCLREQLESWRQFWVRKRIEPSVKLEVVFAWLSANIPPDQGLAPTLVHADYGFHNLMMEKGEITAILDWEFAHMGDPAEDVNYCRQFIERYVPFDYFLERYLARGGKPYDSARDRFFTVWRNVRNAVASIGALNAFQQVTPGNIKMATAGLAYNPRFEMEALRLVADFVESGT